MRIIHVIASVAACRGGPSQGVLELAAASQRQGGTVDIIATNDDGPGLMDVPMGQWVDHQGARVQFFPRFSPRFRPFREFAFSRPMKGWMEGNLCRYDLVHVHGLFSFAPSWAMRVARRSGTAYLIRPSGLLCRWSLQQSRGRKRVFLGLLDRANLDGAAAIEYTAEQEQGEAVDLDLRAPSFVMPYGLSIPVLSADARRLLRQRLDLPPDEAVILYLSRLHPKKGIQHLIPAVARLPADKRFTLVVAGSGDADFEATLKVLVALHGLVDRVRFVGFAGGEWKQVLLQGSDLFVLPSASESFAIAVLEALAAGTPVITTPGVPLSLLVGKFNLGWVCEPEVESLIGALRLGLESLSCPEEVSRRRERSHQLVARYFGWDRIAARMQDVYAAILRGDALPSFALGDIQI